MKKIHIGSKLDDFLEQDGLLKVVTAKAKKSMKNIECDICGQKTVIYTKAHKAVPFVDGRNYDRVCFGCFNVPRTSEQTYQSDGCLKDHIELDYSPEYLHSAKELTNEGCCDTLKEAKQCVEAVTKLCSKAKKSVKLKGKPKPEWIVL